MHNSENPSAIRSRKEITQALLMLMQDHPYSEITVKQIMNVISMWIHRGMNDKPVDIMSMIYQYLQRARQK